MTLDEHLLDETLDHGDQAPPKLKRIVRPVSSDTIVNVSSSSSYSWETLKKTSTKNAPSDTPLHLNQNDVPVGGESELDHDASMDISTGDVLRGAEKVNTGPSMSSQASTAVSKSSVVRESAQVREHNRHPPAQQQIAPPPPPPPLMQHIHL